RVAEKSILDVDHVCVHFRANRRAGRKEKLDHIDFPKIVCVCDFLGVLIGKLKFWRSAHSEQRCFVLLPANVVKAFAANNVVIFTTVYDFGDEYDPENQNDK